MSRPIRLDYSGALHHVAVRGNRRQDIFLDSDERELFYDVLKSVVEDYNWICHADCQMGNHYHLVVEVPEANLSVGMRQLNGVFTQKLNRSRGTVGHVFQGRFFSKLIDGQNYLSAVCRYVSLNPVWAKMVSRPDDWPWGSYRATVGLEVARPHLTVENILSDFADDLAVARTEFRSFVMSGIDAELPFAALHGPILGDDKFIRVVMGTVAFPKRLVREIPRHDRLVGRPSLEEIRRDAVGGREGRNKAMLEAWSEYGYHLSEIGETFGVHCASVGRIVRKLRRKC